MSRCLDGLETIIATHLARDKEQEPTSDQGRDEGLSRIQLNHVFLGQGEDYGEQAHYEISVLLKEKWVKPNSSETWRVTLCPRAFIKWAKKIKPIK